MPDGIKTEVFIFISHSSKDAVIAGQLANLLKSALRLRAEQIRCTSIDGYRLPAGAETADQLREEALSSPVFIGILSPLSLASAYVLFELGARWGAKKPILPLLVAGMGAQALRGPLTALNALSAASPSQLHQLITEVAGALGISTEPPGAYQSLVDAIVTTEHTELSSPTREPVRPEFTPAPYRPPTRVELPEYEGAEMVIHLHCEKEWPNDFHMRKYCMDQQYQALDELKKGRPADIPEDVFQGIRAKCAKEWPDDYHMRGYCEQQQLEAFRALRWR